MLSALYLLSAVSFLFPSCTSKKPLEMSGGFNALLEILTNNYSTLQWRLAMACWVKNFIAIIMWVPFISEQSMFACCHLSYCQSLSLSPLKSARFASSSLSVCLQSNSRMIIHLAALDSSCQPQGLRSSTKGQINTRFFSTSSSVLSPLPISLLGYYTECYVYYNPHAC